MRNRLWAALLLAAGVSGFSALPAAERSAAAAAAPPSPAAVAGAVGHFAMLGKYCMECHNTTDWAGGIALDTMLPEGIPADAKTWEKVLNRTRGGLMPPPGEPRPPAQQLTAFISWMEGTIDKAALGHVDPGQVALHRLNRREYANAVQYLLGVELDPAALLPQDDYSDGFDNIAKVLQVSPSFLDQYLAAARNVALLAVGNPAARPAGTPYVNTDGGKQLTHVEGLPLGTRGGMVVDHIFPADGEYELNIGDMAHALWVEGMEFKNSLVVLLDGRRVYETTLGGEEDQRAIDQKGDPSVDAINKRLKNIRFKAKAGQHKLGVTFQARTFAESDSRLAPLLPGGGEDRVLRVKSFEVRGPFQASGVSDTASRKLIFTCYPKSQAEELPCAQQILSRIARRAYRRPLGDLDLQELVKAFGAARQGRSFDEGIRGALTRLLASPDFLYRAEQAPADVGPGETYRLTDLQLASRLSFFLWSNVPDDELLDVASRGELSKPGQLEKQVRRMLADSKAQTLAADFAFQWLGMKKLADIEPDEAVFPYASNHRDIDGDPRKDFREELRLFIDSVFRENRSVTELLTANYTFLNEPLALHYGIRDVKGANFRRVTLPDSARAGLLGKGAVLMVTSYPNRTAPVLRGEWILDNILGAPPTPPPPNVEALKEPVAGGKVLSVRELMVAHAGQKSCHACHGVMDPLGFSLENFDGVGHWRDKDRMAGSAIDTTAVLPDGTPVNGPGDLRKALLANQGQFVQTLTQKLMSYGTGRLVEWQDMPTIRGIVHEAARSDYRFVPLLMGILNSPQFQMKRVPVDKPLPQNRQAAVVP
jgi:mono/diheme cytochrome c family protein